MKENVKQIYLMSYNSVQTLGWLYLFFKSIRKNIKKKETAWQRTGLILKIFQTTSLLEIVHSSTKLVKSSPKETSQQILARLFITYVVVDKVPKLHESKFLLPLLLSWSVSDIIRYTYYFLKECNYIPYWIKFLRYSAFLGLYPIGMLCEALLILEAFKLQIPNPSTKLRDNIKEKDSITRLSNTHNLSLFLFLILTVPYGYPKMFQHMVSLYLGSYEIDESKNKIFVGIIHLDNSRNINSVSIVFVFTNFLKNSLDKKKV
jgi:very-long-chain (3R)-3-hydroxyacyl-CoA dehydratase